jgi:hypothetical protein
MPQSQKQTVDLVVPPSAQLTYLGVTIDDALRFRVHAATAAFRALQAMGALRFLPHHDWSAPAYVTHHLTLVPVMPKMLWGSPIWWMWSATTWNLLEGTYHRIARWITDLPMSTRITKLLTVDQLPPLDTYINDLWMLYVVRVRFLPTDYILADQPAYIQGAPKPGFPSRRRLDSLIAHLTVGVPEDRFCHINAWIPRIQSPHLDKHTDPVGTQERWIQSLPDFTILLYINGSKLEDGRTGSGWVTYCVGNGIVRRIPAGHCHLGNRVEVFDAKLHAAQEALTALQHLDTTVATAYLCVDNQSGLDTLHGNTSQTQYSQTATAIAAEL